MSPTRVFIWSPLIFEVVPIGVCAREVYACPKELSVISSFRSLMIDCRISSVWLLFSLFICMPIILSICTSSRSSSCKGVAAREVCAWPNFLKSASTSLRAASLSFAVHSWSASSIWTSTAFNSLMRLDCFWFSGAPAKEEYVCPNACIESSFLFS